MRCFLLGRGFHLITVPQSLDLCKTTVMVVLLEVSPIFAQHFSLSDHQILGPFSKSSFYWLQSSRAGHTASTQIIIEVSFMQQILSVAFLQNLCLDTTKGKNTVSNWSVIFCHLIHFKTFSVCHYGLLMMQCLLSLDFRIGLHHSKMWKSEEVIHSIQ